MNLYKIYNDNKWIIILVIFLILGIIFYFSRRETFEGDISFYKDIRPLFLESDIDIMKKIAGLDLSNYEDVKKNAEKIFKRLDEGSMPCYGGWPKENIDKFKEWMKSMRE